MAKISSNFSSAPSSGFMSSWRLRSGHLVLASFGGVSGVGFAQHVEDGGLGFGGVQVVVESGGDAVGVSWPKRRGRSSTRWRGWRPSAAKAASVVRLDGTTEVVPFRSCLLPTHPSVRAFRTAPFRLYLRKISCGAFRRNLKLRSFSTELAADFNPSKVKLS